MHEQSSDPHPLSDLAYDWITLMQNKAQDLLAYDQYIKDAEAAGSAEGAAFFSQGPRCGQGTTRRSQAAFDCGLAMKNR